MAVTVDEVKAHLRIQHDEEDGFILSLIAQAQAVRLAILLFVGFYYENRDVPDHQTYATMREAFENLLYPYRDPEKMF